MPRSRRDRAEMSPRSRRDLHVVARVPVGVEDDHARGSGEVEAEATGKRGDEEEADARVALVKVRHHRIALGDVGRAVEAQIVEPPPPAALVATRRRLASEDLLDDGEGVERLSQL